VYLGPLKWPTKGILLSTAVLLMALFALAAIGVPSEILTPAAVIGVLVVAASRRVKALGADELRDSRPPE
jgi:hypothetical protein